MTLMDLTTFLLHRVFSLNVKDFPSKRKWNELADMPEPRMHFGSARIDGRIFLVGDGFCDVYDIPCNSWTSMRNVPGGFGKNPGLAVVGSNLFVCGNRPASEAFNVFYLLDTETWKWKSLPSPHIRQDVKAVFSHNNLIYVIGWQKSWRNMVHCYDPVASVWSVEAKHISGTILPGTLVRGQVSKSLFNDVEYLEDRGKFGLWLDS